MCQSKAVRKVKRRNSTTIMIDLDYDYEWYADMKHFIDEHIKMMAELFGYSITRKDVRMSRNGNVHIFLELMHDGDIKKLMHFMFALGDDPNHTRLSKIRYQLFGTPVTFLNNER